MSISEQKEIKQDGGVSRKILLNCEGGRRCACQLSHVKFIEDFF
jgi:hypothetical protein